MGERSTPVTVRQLWPPWRYVVIDWELRHPLLGIAVTNGRKIWGQLAAEAFAANHSRRFCDGTWSRENYNPRH
jgi:hypothetical protein